MKLPLSVYIEEMKQSCVEPAFTLFPQQTNGRSEWQQCQLTQRCRADNGNKHTTLWTQPSVSGMRLGLLPSTLVSAQRVKSPALALLAWLVCFGFEISKLKQRHKCEPGGDCIVYMIV